MAFRWVAGSQCPCRIRPGRHWVRPQARSPAGRIAAQPPHFGPLVRWGPEGPVVQFAA